MQTMISIPRLEGVRTQPEGITFRVTCPRTCQITPIKCLELKEKLEGFFFLAVAPHDGIITLHLEVTGQPDTFFSRLENFIAELRAEISHELRFSVEVEY